MPDIGRYAEFGIASTHWTMTLPAAGADFVLEGAEADADVDAPFEWDVRALGYDGVRDLPLANRHDTYGESKVALWR